MARRPQKETALMPIPIAPNSWHRNREGLGIWEGRGKVVATGVGTFQATGG